LVIIFYILKSSILTILISCTYYGKKRVLKKHPWYAQRRKFCRTPLRRVFVERFENP